MRLSLKLFIQILILITRSSSALYEAANALMKEHEHYAQGSEFPRVEPYLERGIDALGCIMDYIGVVWEENMNRDSLVVGIDLYREIDRLLQVVRREVKEISRALGNGGNLVVLLGDKEKRPSTVRQAIGFIEEQTGKLELILDQLQPVGVGLYEYH